jgi:hypothetical protein
VALVRSTDKGVTWSDDYADVRIQLGRVMFDCETLATR